MAENCFSDSPSSQESLLLSPDTYQDLLKMQGSSELLGTLEKCAKVDPVVDSKVYVLSETPYCASRSSIIPTENWPGDVDFHVSFDVQEKNTKQISYTYSESANKLYVRRDLPSMPSPIPFKFSTNRLMEYNVNLRALVVFSMPENANEAVVRCVNHSREELDKGVYEAEHIIRSKEAGARYEIDEETGHRSILLPFKNPPVGQEFSRYIFQFLCFNSCPGGVNRRATALVFTLEKGDRVLGRASVELKICASPGRDRQNAENAVAGTSTSEQNSAKKRKVTDETVPIYGIEPCLVPESNGNSKEKEFVIKVYNEKLYKFLLKMKQFYDFQAAQRTLPKQIILVSSSSDEL